MVRSTIIVALLLVTASFSAGLAVAGQHGDGGQQAGDGGQQNQNETNRTGGQDGGGPPASAAERREKARDRAAQAGLFARLSYQDGHADGRFISFNLSEDTGEVTDYALKHNGTSTTFFSDVTPEAFTSTSPPRVAGSTLILQGEDGRLQAHNNPTGLLRLHARNGSTVTFTLADGADAGDVANGSSVSVDVGDRSGQVILAGNGTLSVDGSTITAELDESGNVIFRAIPLGGSPGEVKQARALGKALADGTLGASLRMAGVNGTPAVEATEYGVNASAREATDGRARVELSSLNRTGKVVNLALDKGTLNVSSADEVEVKLDARSIPSQASIDQVVNATGDQARANVLLTNSTVEITVYVPSFSIHSLVTKDTTQNLADLPDPPSVQNPSGKAVSVASEARQQVTQRAQAWDRLPSTARAEASASARQAGLFSAFEVSGGQASGAFVSLQADASAGTISGFAVQDAGSSVSVFSSVSFDPYTRAQDVTNAGPTLALVGDQVTALVHDTPTGALSVKAASQSVTVTYELATGVSMERVDDTHVKLTAGNTHVHLLVAGGNGELSLEGDQIRLALGGNAQALSLVHPSQATAAATALHERLDAIKQDAFGVQHSVAGAGDQAVETVQSISVDARTKAIETGRQVTTTVSSQAPSPRVVQLDVPSELVGASAAGDVEVQVDGQAVAMANSAADVYAQAGTSQATAHVTAEGGALSVLVNIAGFSDHDVTVSSTDDGSGGGSGGTNDTGGGGSGGTDDGQDAPGLGIVALGALIALAAALTRVRRDR